MTLEKDNGWFKKVFDEHYEYVRNYLYYLSGDINIAEDLVQDVFMLFWEERHKMRKETIRSFLFTVAKNSYYKHHRKKNIHLNFMNSLVSGRDNESPEFLLELKEFDRKLQDAIAGVPEKTRAIFLMSRIDNMTYAEIAENLNIGTKAVEKHMTKALKLLREKVDRKL
jgi:RNA polymerase sigma-70 factor (ECF subfamily)